MNRIVDFTIALLLLLLLSPLLLLLLVLVMIFIGWPPLFVQTRPGQYGQLFKMVKLRSMSNARDENGQLLPDTQRMGKFGRFLRRSSLDELPELINVLRGDMSLVGPRPLLPDYLELYSSTQARRHLVKPGITGWAQINGRNAISWPEKLSLDVWYVDNKNFMLDVKILFMTVTKVLKREDIDASMDTTMERFTGNHQSEKKTVGEPTRSVTNDMCVESSS